MLVLAVLAGLLAIGALMLALRRRQDPRRV
jgi:hypothetical protein